MYKFLVDVKYTAEDLATMSRAYEMAAAMLGIDRTQTNDRLGWTIMKLFAQGVRDAKQIAMTAVDQEKSG